MQSRSTSIFFTCSSLDEYLLENKNKMLVWTKIAFETKKIKHCFGQHKHSFLVTTKQCSSFSSQPSCIFVFLLLLPIFFSLFPHVRWLCAMHKLQIHYLPNHFECDRAIKHAWYYVLIVIKAWLYKNWVSPFFCQNISST